MPELVESTRRAFRDDRTSPDTSVAEPTFADIAARYLERHVRRHLVPRAYALALYAHTFLATVEVPAPNGGTVPFPEKPFHLITTDDVEDAIEQKAQPGITTVRRPGRRTWTRTVGGGPTANRLHAYLRGLWRWAIAKGYSDATPFARAGLPTLRMRPEHARERRFVGDSAPPRVPGSRTSRQPGEPAADAQVSRIFVFMIFGTRPGHGNWKPAIRCMLCLSGWATPI